MMSSGLSKKEAQPRTSGLDLAHSSLPDRSDFTAVSSAARTNGAPSLLESMRAGALFLMPFSLIASLGCNADSSPKIPLTVTQTALEVADRKALTEDAAWTVQNSVVHVSGQPFFPLGVYWVSHDVSPETKARRLNDLEKISQAGFNMIHTPVDRNDREFLDKCASLGIYVAVEFNDDPLEVVAQFKSHPAVAIWSIFDDVDAPAKNGGERHSPQKVKETHFQFKTADPLALTYISAGYPQRFSAYTNCSDLMAFQTYPIPSEPLSSVTSSYSNVAASHNQGFVANLQTFGWHGIYRPPTGGELRNMTYQALLTGVKGVLYYTFFDEVTDLGQNHELLAAATQIAKEVRALEPFLLNGERRTLPITQPEVFATQWILGHRLLVIAVNASTAPADIEISLPEKDVTAVKPPLGDAAVMTLQANKLSGRISAGGVAVCEFKLP
ncbi:MAG: hypothetical protein GX589_02860 [Deltaproteobacteria bacterium]|nr:hypothetical protein [Deltaproteobacteria bacterium]